MAVKVAAGAVALLCSVLSSSCSGTEAEDPAEEAQQEKLRHVSSLDCQEDKLSVGVFDGSADASGEASPEAAAQLEVAEERLRRDGLTQRTTSDATGTLYVDYVTADGRLVMYVRPRQQPDGTWVVEQVVACG